MAKFLTNASGATWWPNFFLIQVTPPGGWISNKCMWYHLFMFTKFASYKVPPVLVSTHGSVVPLAMFSSCKDYSCHLHLVQAVQVSNSSSAKSCDHISIEGTDCDIHWGWSDMALMVLLSKVIINSQVWQFELKILGCAQSFWYSWSILKTRKLFLPIILFLRHFASLRSWPAWNVIGK